MEKVCIVLTVLALAVMTIINIVHIFFRYIFNISFVWVFPLTLLLFIWMTFLGIFVVYRQKKSIVVKFFLNLMPAGAQNIILLSMNILIMALLVLILAEGPGLLQKQASLLQVIPLPRYVQAIPLLIGIAGIFADYLVETADLVKVMMFSSES